jgi:hypothetical protein
VSADVPWITVKGETQGTGNKDIKYEVDRNRSDTIRIGILTVAGLPHVVTQAAGR